LVRTEKTHAGTLVEIALARALPLADGTALDYTIAGTDVDCKFSHRLGGWMIPPEAEAKLLLLVQASDEDGTWSAGLIRASEANLSPAGNRDGKRTLNERGRATVRWLHVRAPLQENVLIKMPERDVAAVFALPSGQQRVNELFRRAQRMRVSRTVVATVAMQDDYMKRVRDGGGARDQLRDEGIVIFGDYAGDQLLAAALGLPRPGAGEFVSARLARRVRVAVGAGSAGSARAGSTGAVGAVGAFGAGSGSEDESGRESGDGRKEGYDRRFIRLDGADWVLAEPTDPLGRAPGLPRLSGSAACAARIMLMRVAGDAQGAGTTCCWRHDEPCSGRHGGRLCRQEPA
jgi:hypothetical protein